MARDKIATAARGRVRATVRAIELNEWPEKSPVECNTGAMARCVRVAPFLLVHVNVVIAMIAGGALVTAARFKWDPSTYVLVRMLFPVEYRVMASVLTGAGFALIVLAHLAVVALATRRRSARRVLLFLYAVLMCALAVVEVAWCGWMVRRLLLWLNTAEAAHILEAMQFRHHIKRILGFIGRIIPLSQQIQDLIKEVEEDVPSNLYSVAAGAVLLAVAQAAAVLLALGLALFSRQPRLSHSWVTTSTSTSATGSSAEKAPLRTAYKNGRIVIL